MKTIYLVKTTFSQAGFYATSTDQFNTFQLLDERTIIVVPPSQMISVIEVKN